MLEFLVMFYHAAFLGTGWFQQVAQFMCDDCLYDIPGQEVQHFVDEDHIFVKEYIPKLDRRLAAATMEPSYR